MRVLQFMIGSFGGAERFFVRLCRALGARGVDQLVLINDHPNLVEDVRRAGLEFRIFEPSRLGGLLDRRRLNQHCRRFQPDIVTAWMNRAARRLPEGPHVNVGRLGGYYPVKHYGRCDHLVANTPGIVASSIAQGWPADRISMISNFIDDLGQSQSDNGNTAGPPRAAVGDQTFGIGKDVPVLCGLGRLDAWKGFDTLIQALAHLEGAVLLLAGQGPEECALRMLAERCGVGDRVHFLGWLEDRAALLRRADICVVPSRHEALGNVVLEAWSVGCPVVAAACEGPRWLIEHGVTGLLFPPGDVDTLTDMLRQAIADAPGRERWATHAAARWQRDFTEEAICSSYIKLFQDLAAARGWVRSASRRN
jgi:glycosyltransferase involved in cell wall biosynthesis